MNHHDHGTLPGYADIRVSVRWSSIKKLWPVTGLAKGYWIPWYGSIDVGIKV